MNYKLTTILLALVVIGLLIKLYFEESPKASEDLATTQEPSNRVNLVDYSQVNWPKVDANTGKLIPSADAAKMLDDHHNYRLRIDSTYDREKEIYGFTFGINMVDSLMNKVKAHNKRNTNPKEEIIALRVYYGWKKDTTLGIEYNDVFIVPAKGENARNFYPIDPLLDVPLDEDLMILNMSAPCPNKCNQ